MAYAYKINPFTARLDIVSAGGISAGSWGAAVTKTLHSGAATLDGPGRYLIDTEGAAASDSLNTIHGLSDGNEIILRAVSSVRTVALRNATGNLRLQANFNLNHNLDSSRLICDASGFVVESGGRSDNG